MIARTDQRTRPLNMFCPAPGYTVQLPDAAGALYDVLVCGHGAYSSTPACEAAWVRIDRSRERDREDQFRRACRRVAGALGIPEGTADTWTQADLALFADQLERLAPVSGGPPRGVSRHQATAAYRKRRGEDWVIEAVHGPLDAIAGFTYSGALAVGRRWYYTVPGALLVLFVVGSQFGWLSAWLIEVL